MRRGIRRRARPAVRRKVRIRDRRGLRHDGVRDGRRQVDLRGAELPRLGLNPPLRPGRWRDVDRYGLPIATVVRSWNLGAVIEPEDPTVPCDPRAVLPGL